MKSRQLKKAMATLLAAGLVASSTMVAWAETATSVTVTGENKQTVDGVENHEMKSGVSVQPDGDNNLGGSVTVSGDIKIDDTEKKSSLADGIVIENDSGTDASGKGTVTVNGDVSVKSTTYGSGGGISGISTYAGATVTVNGNIEVTNKYDTWGVYDGNNKGVDGVYIQVGRDVTSTSTNSIAYGVNNNSEKDSKIEIGGKVNAHSDKNDAYGVWTSNDASDCQTTSVEVGKGINATSKSATAYGAVINPGLTAELTVDGGIHANGGVDAVGISVFEKDPDSAQGKSVSIGVTGDVDANATTGTGNAIQIYDLDGDVTIVVDGDIKGTTTGLNLTDNLGNVVINTSGTISSTSGAAIVANATTAAAQSAALPEITAWKIKSGTEDLVASDDAGYASKVQSAINYIIKSGVTEDGKDTSNGTIKLTGTTGVKIGDTTYETANEGDEITINVETVSGYKYSLSNGEALLTANEDGSYTLKIPAGGGVDLKAVLEKIVEQKKSSSSDNDNDDSSSASVVVTSTSSTSSGAEATSVSVEGVKILVEDPAFAEDGSLTHGLIVTENMTVAAATGEAKRAGLPEAVTATLDAIDAGNLAAVPIATGAMSVLAKTVAITKVAPNTQMQLVMAKAKVPASGIVQVLYYLNTTGQFILLPAIVDPATGIVTFAAPGDGTAAIIG